MRAIPFLLDNPDPRIEAFEVGTTIRIMPRRDLMPEGHVIVGAIRNGEFLIVAEFLMTEGKRGLTTGRFFTSSNDAGKWLHDCVMYCLDGASDALAVATDAWFEREFQN